MARKRGFKKKKVTEREETNAQKVVQKEQMLRLKQQRAKDRAAVQATKAAEKEAATRAKAT
jgi:hypothetical protein